MSICVWLFGVQLVVCFGIGQVQLIAVVIGSVVEVKFISGYISCYSDQEMVWIYIQDIWY